MPGETRELTAQYVPNASVFGGVEVRVSGWNVDPATIMLKEGRGHAPPPPLRHLEGSNVR